MRWTSGSAQASSQASVPATSNPTGSVTPGGRGGVDDGHEPPHHVLLDRLQDGGEERGLVVELVVQRAAGDAGGTGDPLRADVGEAVLGEERAGGVDEQTTGGGGAVHLAAAVGGHGSTVP